MQTGSRKDEIPEQANQGRSGILQFAIHYSFWFLQKPIAHHLSNSFKVF